MSRGASEVRDAAGSRCKYDGLAWLSGGVGAWSRLPLWFIPCALLACSTSSSSSSSSPPTQGESRVVAVQPVGAHAACETIQPPELIKKVEPRYPEVVRRSRIEGEVVMTAALRPDGVLEDIKVLASPNRSLSTFSVEAL